MTSTHCDGPRGTFASYSYCAHHAALYARTSLWYALVVSAGIACVANRRPLHAQPARDGAVAQALPDSVRIADAVARVRDAAQRGSVALSAARAARDLAVARAAARGHAAPLSLSAGLSEAPAANLDQGNLRLELGRDLLTGPKRHAERALADVDVLAADADLAATARQLEAALVRDVVHAAGALRIAERLASEDQVLVGADAGVRGRFAVGEARYVDVLRVRTERLRVQSERSSALAESRAARARLRVLLTADSARGALDAALLTLANADGNAWRSLLSPPPSLDSLVALSAAVQIGAIDIERAARERALSALEMKPQVNAFAGIQRIGQANNGPTLGPSLGVTVSLPFTAATANRLTARATEQRVATARRARDATRTDVMSHLSAALERYAAARSRLDAFDAALLRGAREERESALAAYRTGSLTLLELLDFERALSRAETEHTRALMDAIDAWADLMGAEDLGAPGSLASASGR